MRTVQIEVWGEVFVVVVPGKLLGQFIMSRVLISDGVG